MITKEEFFKQTEQLITTSEMASYAKKIKKYNTISNILIAVLIIGAVLSVIFLSVTICFAFTFPAFLVFVISTIAKNSVIDKINTKYSGQIFEMLLQNYKYYYNKKEYINETYLLSSGFIGNFSANSIAKMFDSSNVFSMGYRPYDHYTGEDFLRLNIPKDDNTSSDVYLNICDLHVTRRETDSEGNSHTVTVYNGAFGYVHFPFQFKCDLSLNVGMFTGKQRIKLEDINFNKKFATYTNNHVEALVILTPTLMTKLLEFNKRVGKFKLSLTQEGYLYFGMNKRLFNLKHVKTPSPKMFENYYDDIASILALVNEIKNNNKVFKF